MKDIMTYKTILLLYISAMRTRFSWAASKELLTWSALKAGVSLNLRLPSWMRSRITLKIRRVNGKDPEKAYRGSFNIRISPELHRQAVRHALVENISLNQLIEKAIAEKVNHAK